MTEPSSVAITAAAVAGAATGAAMAPTSPLLQYAIGCGFAVTGAVSWQFLQAQRAREDAAGKGIAAADRPTIDWRTVAYAAPGAALSAGTILYFATSAGGQWNLLSIGAFMLAGAAGPELAKWATKKLLAVLSTATGG